MSIEQVKAAIIALGDGKVGQGAHDDLMRFEASRAAWEVAAQLLYDSSSLSNAHEFRFFGAKMLYSKIQRDFDQISEGNVPAFMNSLVQHIIALSQIPNVEMKVCRYVCLSIAALAVQINQPGVIKAVLLWLNPILTTAPKVVLEFLAVLPEECINQRVSVSASTRQAFELQLTDSFQEVFTFLSSLWLSPIMNEDAKRNILECIDKWIDFTHITAATLVAQPLFVMVFDCFAVPDLFAPAAAVISTAFMKFKESEEITYLLRVVLPRILPLRNTWNQLVSNPALEGDHDLQDMCHAISKLFSLVTEAALPELLTPTTEAFGLWECVQQLLECCKYPYDLNTSKFPLTFFYMLSTRIVDALEGNGVSDGQNQGQKLLNTYSPTFKMLLDISLDQSCLSEDYFVLIDDTSRQGCPTISDDEAERRDVWQETIMDCRAVLGISASMTQVCTRLQTFLQVIETQSYSEQKWAPVEACLFLLKFLVVRVASDEAVMMPWLLDKMLRFPNLYGLKPAFIDLSGSCAQWLMSNPACLPHILSQISNTLQCPDFTIQSAMAISNIFQKCHRVPNLPIAEMNSLIMQMRQYQLLSLSADNAILEGFCAVISSLPEKRMVTDSMNVIVGCLNEDLSNSIANATCESGQPKVFNASTLAGNIDRLTTVFKCLQIDRDNYSMLFQQVYTMLQQVLNISKTNSYLCEKVCRCYKYVMRTMKRDFEPFLPQMTRHLADEFARNPLAAFLYGGSICVAEFGKVNDSTIFSGLVDMLRRMTQAFFRDMSSIELFEHKPDLVEEFFFLMAKTTQYAPEIFLQAQQEQTTIYFAGVVGLQIKHRDAHRGILTFFENFLRNIDIPNRDKKDRDATALYNRAYSDRYLSIAGAFGAELVKALVGCLSGELTVHTLGGTRNVVRLLLEVRHIANRMSGHTFHEWLSAAMMSLAPEVQQMAIDLKLVELSSATEDDCYRSLDKFFLKAQRLK